MLLQFIISGLKDALIYFRLRLYLNRQDRFRIFVGLHIFFNKVSNFVPNRQQRKRMTNLTNKLRKGNRKKIGHYALLLFLL